MPRLFAFKKKNPATSALRSRLPAVAREARGKRDTVEAVEKLLKGVEKGKAKSPQAILRPRTVARNAAKWGLRGLLSGSSVLLVAANKLDSDPLSVTGATAFGAHHFLHKAANERGLLARVSASEAERLVSQSLERVLKRKPLAGKKGVEADLKEVMADASKKDAFSKALRERVAPIEREAVKLEAQLAEARKYRRHGGGLPSMLEPEVRIVRSGSQEIHIAGIEHSYERDLAKRKILGLEKGGFFPESTRFVGTESIIKGVKTQQERKRELARHSEGPRVVAIDALQASRLGSNILGLNLANAASLLNPKTARAMRRIASELPEKGNRSLLSNRFRDMQMAHNLLVLGKLQEKHGIKQPLGAVMQHEHAKNVAFYLEHPEVLKRHMRLAGKATKGKFGGFKWTGPTIARRPEEMDAEEEARKEIGKLTKAGKKVRVKVSMTSQA